MYETLRIRQGGAQHDTSDITLTSDGPPLSFTGRLARWSATHR